MTSVSMMSVDFCARCAEKTLHDAGGCIHCQKQPPVVVSAAAPTKPAERVSRHYPQRHDGAEITPHKKHASRARRTLSPLQVSIAELLGQGENSRAIAAKLRIKVAKVTNQMYRARELLDVPSTADVIAHVQRQKLQGAT